MFKENNERLPIFVYVTVHLFGDAQNVNYLLGRRINAHQTQYPGV